VRHVHAFGYPAEPNPPYDGKRLIACEGTSFWDLVFEFGNMALRCDMQGGASGGPWIADLDPATGIGTIVSVYSQIMMDAAYAQGPYFGPEVRSMYEQVRRLGPTDAFIPLGQREILVTGIQIQNQDTAHPTRVRLEYVNSSGQVQATREHDIPAGGSVTSYNQGPPGFSGGVHIARTQATTGRLAVTVNHLGSNRHTVASSPGFTSGARRVLLPLLMHDHYATSTTIAVQNVSPQPVQVAVSYRDQTGPIADLPGFTLKPSESRFLLRAASCARASAPCPPACSPARSPPPATSPRPWPSSRPPPWSKTPDSPPGPPPASWPPR